MQNKITVLIPTYRRPQFLKRAILSALTQPYANLQVSVFDDASGDNTENIINALKEKDSRISYHCHEKNIGALKNVKYAFQSINTPYFCHIGDDDALTFDFFDNSVKILDENPDIMFVSIDLLIIDEDANLVSACASDSNMRFFRGKNRLNLTCSSTTYIATLFRKEVAQIYLEMDSRFDIGPDMRFMTHAKAKYDFAHLSKVGAFFTNHSNTMSASKKRFDIVHLAVQLSRYVEIYHDETLDKEFRDEAVVAIRKISTHSLKGSIAVFIGTLKDLIKRVCEKCNLTDASFSDSEKDARNAGHYSSAMLYRLMRIKITQDITFFYSMLTMKN
ncbi:MAG: glycosyltransferase family 2 protein [Gammaproteobacteria bacterium]|nr:glycosyltransferase family 2 protein [Gammaproteobacteria bacterium]